MLSTLGGVVSVPIGYAGTLLKAIPGLPFGSPQVLSGLHVFWIVLTAIVTKKAGSCTIAGFLKGSIELLFFSPHGIFVLLISVVQGLTVDILFTVVKRINTASICLAGGLSSASNVVILQLLLLPILPNVIIAFMYVTSFLSGLLFAGYLSKKILEILSSMRRPKYT
jgi:ABC-type thiamin/hydroxymethylpyrimidine transport system permease subunit